MRSEIEVLADHFILLWKPCVLNTGAYRAIRNSLLRPTILQHPPCYQISPSLSSYLAVDRNRSIKDGVAAIVWDLKRIAVAVGTAPSGGRTAPNDVSFPSIVRWDPKLHTLPSH